ncbi:MAG TPA: glycoside hydrolase family 15 protein [Actinomycetota bacterium]|nr:glycoside hydrolase family 15 protein [Actinomycetota bacterium]
MSKPATSSGAGRYRPIGDYAFLGDCHTGALVSSDGSVDWLCLPRLDDGSYFGRLLDRERGGWCAITPTDPAMRTSRRYLDGTLVLETETTVAGGRVRVTDCLTMRPGGAQRPYRQLLRVVDGLEGAVDLRVEVVPRFDYGQVRPWIRRAGHTWQALGGDDGLVIEGDVPLVPSGLHALVAEVRMAAGQRLRLGLRHVLPEVLDSSRSRPPGPAELDRRLEQTVAWWRGWSARGDRLSHDQAALIRSATVLKALTQARTGAIAAAATTSLPEAPGGPRNWDYRASWVRDSVFALRSLAELGYTAEADGFRRFVQRSAAGSAQELQIMYGLGGERRLVELTLDDLEGYGGARPVRIGNAAARQHQHDVYGELLDLAWAWHRQGHSPNADDWRFLVELVNEAAKRWTTPDRGIWELRGPPRHLVHSKVMCWVALDRGLRLADEVGFPAPVRRWSSTREMIRAAVERHGYDPGRGVFTQTFDRPELDAALLLLPSTGFVAWDDPRMRRTVDAIRRDLESDGLLLRYRAPDGLKGTEGTFVACTFWLAECLARQGRTGDARAAFATASATANDLGLFAEEFDPATGTLLGNFPQALTHLSHIAAAVALEQQDD